MVYCFALGIFSVGFDDKWTKELIRRNYQYIFEKIEDLNDKMQKTDVMIF